jgi:hypothetical protein
MTASRAGVAVVAAFLALARGEPRACAAEVTVVAGLRVAAPACPISPVAVPAFVDSLRVELAGHARVPGTRLVTLAIEPCDTATTRVHVAVTGDAGETVAEREVGLEDIALEARPRALALAVAELVRGPQLPPPPAPAPAVAAPPPAAPAPTFRAGVAADALVAFFPSRETTLWGGRLSATLDHPRLGLAVFAEAAAGEQSYDVGTVAVQSFGGGVTIGPRWRAGRVALEPALVGALGWARVQGHADAPDVTAGTGSGLTAAVRARAALSTIFVRVVRVRAFVEGGWMLRGFDATVDGATAAGASGATLVLGVGLGL